MSDMIQNVAPEETTMPTPETKKGKGTSVLFQFLLLILTAAYTGLIVMAAEIDFANLSFELMPLELPKILSLVAKS